MLSFFFLFSFSFLFFFFFFNDTATTEIYTLSLHDALPIFVASKCVLRYCSHSGRSDSEPDEVDGDRKSTRLNSIHLGISYAVFCLKKKKKKKKINKIIKEKQHT